MSDDIERAIWEKFVFLVGLSGMTTLTRCPLGPIRENPTTRDLLLQVMSEAAQIGRARGVNLADDCAGRQLAFMDALPRDMVSSMLGDLQRGNPLELEWLSGTVARVGAGAGHPRPRQQLRPRSPHAARRGPPRRGVKAVTALNRTAKASRISIRCRNWRQSSR